MKRNRAPSVLNVNKKRKIEPDDSSTPTIDSVPKGSETITNNVNLEKSKVKQFKSPFRTTFLPQNISKEKENNVTSTNSSKGKRKKFQSPLISSAPSLSPKPKPQTLPTLYFNIIYSKKKKIKTYEEGTLILTPTKKILKNLHHRIIFEDFFNLKQLEKKPENLEEGDEIDVHNQYLIEIVNKLSQEEVQREEQLFKKPMRGLNNTIKDKKIETKPIDRTNIGFKLLEKLGWKEGESLGKDSHDTTSLKEPIEIILKKSKAGIGKK